MTREPTPGVTLVGLIEAVVTPAGLFRNLTEENGMAFRAAAQRLRDEALGWSSSRQSTADFGETEASKACDAVLRTLERINGGPVLP